MKLLQLLTFFLVFPLVFHAQKTLTGLWVGTLENDSTTIRKDQAFELAITEYKGKVYGYSRMTFTVNDTLYYIVKRIKGNVGEEICEVKDDDIITHNFPRKPDKGVRLVSTFRRNLQDSIWKLDGDWKTTETKRHGYYSISGKISLVSEPDFEKSKLFPHLEELNIAKDIQFYAESKKKEAEVHNSSSLIAVKKETNQNKRTDLVKTEPSKQVQPVSNNHPTDKEIGLASGKENPKQIQPVSNNQPVNKEISRVSSNEKPKQVQPVPNDQPADKEISQVSSNEKPKQEHPVKQAKPEPTMEEALASTSLKKSDAPANNLPAQTQKKIDTDQSRPEIKNQVVVKINEPVVAEASIESKTETKKTDPSSLAKLEPEKKIITNEIVKPTVKSTSSAAVFVAERKIAAPQVLMFKSDSLVIKLYDNGEIDGDTVSVLLNGEILMAKQGLKASAIKKTIYIQPGQDELNLVLYAENLGKYPPNTGLLVVNDGEDTYQLRFSADLQQNAAIIFRRKK